MAEELDPRAKLLIRREVHALVGAGLVALAGLNVIGWFTIAKGWVASETSVLVSDELPNELDRRTVPLAELERRAGSSEMELLKATRACATVEAKRDQAESTIRTIEVLRSKVERADATLEKIKAHADATDGLTSALAAILQPLVVAEVQPVPVGTIAAWLGSSAPDGWAICKGQKQEEWLDSWAKSKLREQFPSALPDLQGYFLRGLDERPETARIDHGPRKPDWRIGSTQEDTVGPHVHPLDLPSGGSGPDAVGNAARARRGVVLSNAGLETRPVNVAVHWIIRVE